MMKNKFDFTPFKGILAFIIYFIITTCASVPLELLKIDISKLSRTTVYLYEFLIYIIIIFLIYLLFKKDINKSIKDFWKNKDTYFKKYFKYWFLIIGLILISNTIILAVTNGTTANNQESINKMMESSPFFTFILSVLFAPIVEELSFRLSFRKMFKNNLLFIITSGVVFGSFHVLPVLETWVDLLYIIPYSIPGIIFAYILSDSDNICVPISLHFFHNGLLMALQIFLLLFT